MRIAQKSGMVIGVSHDMPPQEPFASPIIQEKRNLRRDGFAFRVATTQKCEGVLADECFGLVLILRLVIW